MKKFLALLIVTLAIGVVGFRAEASILFTEEYPTTYGDGTALGNNVATGGYNTKWPNGNSSGSGNPVCTSAGALTYSGLQPISASASYGLRVATGTSRNAVAPFTSQSGDGNSAYLSFLIKVTATTPTARILAGLRNSTGGGNLACAIGINGSRQLTVFKNSSSSSATHPTALNQNETYLVVLRLKFQGGSDEVALWVNPATGQTDESGAGVTPTTTTANSDMSSVLALHLLSASDASGPLYLDEFRVGTTWADVTPGSGPVIATKLGFTTQPADAQVSTTMNPVVVQVQSAGGFAAASNGVPITLTLSGGGTLSGTLTRNTDAGGAATFNDLSINAVGTGKQLTANASGIGAGLASAVSSTFTISSEPVITGLVITQALMRPSGFAVRGVGGDASELYNILASPDIALPVSQWAVAATPFFDGNGNFNYTNPVSPALPRQFYRVLANTSNTKIVAPSITQSPANQTVASNQTATFSVTAAGPLLYYLWYFNGSPVSGATSSALVINNAQGGNAGNYYAVVANGAGSATSATAMLRVGNFAPSITTQPQNQTVTAGGTALFQVVADGTAPLRYQWYYNISTLLPNATNALLTLSGVQTNQAGQYSVVVSNSLGTLSSALATLTVTAVPTDLPETNMLGWAAFQNVTGGSYGGATETLIATNYYSFSNFVRQLRPLTIQVPGLITNEELYCYVYGNNKTIVGVGTNAGFIGDLRLNATNIIIQNLYFTGGTNDLITIDGGSKGTGKNIWVDHCTFYNAPDGSLDITKGADYVTVSWCKFSYAPIPRGTVDHEYVNLIGSSDSDDASQFHVTFHHNWWGAYCRERMPSVRFGRVHVLNNYYDCVDNNYCVRTRINAEVLVENNYYIGVQNPWERFVTSGTAGKLHASGNITNNCTFVSGWVSGAVVIPGNDTLGSDLNPPPYAYTLGVTADVPYYVQTYSGNGKYPYVSP